MVRNPRAIAGTCRSIDGNRGLRIAGLVDGDSKQRAADHRDSLGVQPTHRDLGAGLKCLRITIVLLQHAMVMLTDMAVYRRL
jgi:hypothetical protein